ncbi:hypothetical protein Q9189_005202 [Teloschistes chrysophthalmus]
MASSIGDDINAATRPHHTTLNRLILHHLPSALPPSTPSSSSPHIYALGLSHILPIYSTFESSFHKALQPCALPSPLLQNLHTPALERAEALKSDLAILLPPEYRTPDFDALPRLREFKQHIRRVLREKPHLLVAYTWIFYMALFSGGRYIRSKLRDAFAALSPVPILASTATTTTSTSDPQTKPDALAGLTFWTFPPSKNKNNNNNSDGEDLKLLYKSRIAFLSPTLTPQEREDIVEESVEIMRRLTDIVNEIAESVPALVAARMPAGHHAMGEGGAVAVPVWAR